MYATQKNINKKEPIVNINAYCNKYLKFPDKTSKRQAEGGLRLDDKYKSSIIDKPLITVVTVVYNNEATIERCIQSVLEQTYDNIEYIIVDGGSSDGTLDIIEKYKDAIDYFISEPDGGIYYAMNKGISLASGDYLNFMNSDDWYLDNTISNVVSYINKTEMSVIYGRVNYCDIDENVLHMSHNSMIDSNLFDANTLPHQATFYATKIIDIVGNFSTDYKIAADAELSYKIKLLNFKFINTNLLLANYTKGGVSTTNWDLGKLECFFSLLNLGIWDILTIKKNLKRLSKVYTKLELKEILKHLKPIFIDFDSLLDMIFDLDTKQSILLVNDDIWNPFNKLITNSLENMGYKCDLSCEYFFLKKHYNIIILEWENYLFFDKWFNEDLLFEEKLERIESILKYYSKFSLILSIRHNENITGHSINTEEESKIAQLIYRYTKGITFLGTEYTLYQKKYLSNLKLNNPIIFELSHPLYTMYTKIYNRETARKKLNIEDSTLVILSFGAVRSQEDMNLLFDTFNKLKYSNKKLLIVGRVDKNIVYDKENKNVVIEDRFVSDNEIDLYLNSTDIVFLPRLFSLNSGTLFLGISYSKIVMGPNVGNIGLILNQLNYPVFNNKEEALSSMYKAIDFVKKPEIPYLNHVKFMKKINNNTLGIQFKNIFKQFNTNSYSNVIMSKLNTQLAPIIVFTYNRVDVLEKTIIALSKNYLAEETDLYIFSDGAKLHKKDDKEKVEEVREYIKTISGFKSVTIKEQVNNIGLAKSVIGGITEVSKKYENFIVLEDDLLTSPFFLKYMNEALIKYKDEDEVWGINGMALNPECLELPEDYKYDSYFNYRNSSHGWASWSNRWEKAVWNHSQIKYELSDYRQQLLFNRGGNDMYPMMQSQFSGNIDSWAIRWSYSISKHNGVTLSPRYSYVTAQVSNEGTHIKGYTKSLDNDLSLSLENISYPTNFKVNIEIAKKFALNYNSKVPIALEDNIEKLNKIDLNSEFNVAIIQFTQKGGAGIAAERLHNGLLNTNINSNFVNYDEPNAKVANCRYYDNKENRDTILNFSQFTNGNIYSGNTIFSLSYPSLSFKDLDTIIENNDIINLHWLPRILSTEAIAYLSHSNVPIVWTFHDINPISGGCHYFHGCENWKTDCMNCPQLIDNYNDFPAKVLDSKKKYINFKNITVVVLNQHFKKLVEQSPLFDGSRVEVIPNSIDTDRFKPLDKEKIRKKLGLKEDKKYILYVAAYASTIKGYKEFEETIEEYEKQYSSHNIEILLAGNLPKNRDIKLPYKELGHVNEDEIIELYSASDVTVLSSIEDNLPNVILESFACGTPIVGFKVGGLPDLVKDDYNGYTVELGDIKGLADSINKVLNGKDMSKNCREYAERNLKLEVQARRYKELYKNLLIKPVEVTGKQNSIPEVFAETAPTIIGLLNKTISRNKNISSNQNVKQLPENLSKIKNDKWYRFGQMSRKRKIWTIGKVASKRLGIYNLLKPYVPKIKKIYKAGKK